MQGDEYIQFVNKTYSKSCSKRAALPYLVSFYIDKPSKILDFGAGKDAFGTKYLRGLGYDVTAYDIGCNFVEGLHDPEALSKDYRVMMASNVINVQPTEENIREIFKIGAKYQVFFFNYPNKPRKSCLQMKKIIEIAKEYFDKVIPMGISGGRSGYCRMCTNANSRL